MGYGRPLPMFNVSLLCMFVLARLELFTGTRVWPYSVLFFWYYGSCRCEKVGFLQRQRICLLLALYSFARFVHVFGRVFCIPGAYAGLDDHVTTRSVRQQKK